MKNFLEEEGQKRKERTLTNKTQRQNPKMEDQKKTRVKRENWKRKNKDQKKKRIKMDKKKNGRKK